MLRLFTHTDAELLTLIRGTDTERDKALSYIIKTWKRDMVAVLLRQNATHDELEYCVQEALIVLDRQVRTNNFRESSSLKTYYVGIGKQIFRNKTRWQIGEKTDELDDKTLVFNPKNAQNDLENEDIQNFVQQVLAALPSRCREVLRLYMNELSNRQIQEQLNLPSEGAANFAAFDCRKKFKELCEKNPIFKRIKEELIGND